MKNKTNENWTPMLDIAEWVGISRIGRETSDIPSCLLLLERNEWYYTIYVDKETGKIEIPDSLAGDVYRDIAFAERFRKDISVMYTLLMVPKYIVIVGAWKLQLKEALQCASENRLRFVSEYETTGVWGEDFPHGMIEYLPKNKD